VKYYLKHLSMQKNGKNIDMLNRVDSYVENNLDTLY